MKYIKYLLSYSLFLGVFSLNFTVEKKMTTSNLIKKTTMEVFFDYQKKKHQGKMQDFKKKMENEGVYLKILKDDEGKNTFYYAHQYESFVQYNWDDKKIANRFNELLMGDIDVNSGKHIKNELWQNFIQYINKNQINQKQYLIYKLLKNSALEYERENEKQTPLKKTIKKYLEATLSNILLCLKNKNIKEQIAILEPGKKQSSVEECDKKKQIIAESSTLYQKQVDVLDEVFLLEMDDFIEKYYNPNNLPLKLNNLINSINMTEAAALMPDPKGKALKPNQTKAAKTIYDTLKNLQHSIQEKSLQKDSIKSLLPDLNQLFSLIQQQNKIYYGKNKPLSLGIMFMKYVDTFNILLSRKQGSSLAVLTRHKNELHKIFSSKYSVVFWKMFCMFQFIDLFKDIDNMLFSIEWGYKDKDYDFMDKLLEILAKETGQISLGTSKDIFQVGYKERKEMEQIWQTHSFVFFRTHVTNLTIEEIFQQICRSMMTSIGNHINVILKKNQWKPIQTLDDILIKNANKLYEYEEAAVKELQTAVTTILSKKITDEKIFVDNNDNVNIFEQVACFLHSLKKIMDLKIKKNTFTWAVGNILKNKDDLIEKLQSTNEFITDLFLLAYKNYYWSVQQNNKKINGNLINQWHSMLTLQQKKNIQSDISYMIINENITVQELSAFNDFCNYIDEFLFKDLTLLHKKILEILSIEYDYKPLYDQISDQEAKEYEDLQPPLIENPLEISTENTNSKVKKSKKISKKQQQDHDLQSKESTKTSESVNKKEIKNQQLMNQLLNFYDTYDLLYKSMTAQITSTIQELDIFLEVLKNKKNISEKTQYKNIIEKTKDFVSQMDISSKKKMSFLENLSNIQASINDKSAVKDLGNLKELQPQMALNQLESIKKEYQKKQDRIQKMSHDLTVFNDKKQEFLNEIIDANDKPHTVQDNLNFHLYENKSFNEVLFLPTHEKNKTLDEEERQKRQQGTVAKHKSKKTKQKAIQLPYEPSENLDDNEEKKQ
jgi:hypothetical protein